MTARPALISVNAQNIPDELRRRSQFVLWKYVVRDRKPTKFPFACNGEPAKSNDPSTWATFDAVVDIYRHGGYDGIGLMFAAGGNLAGIDLDSCIDSDRNVAPWARAIFDSFHGVAYGEVSPSGGGIKLFVHATPREPFNVKVDPASGDKLPKRNGSAKGKAPGVECYAERRFFCLTGQVFEDFSTIGDAQEAIDKLVNRYKPVRSPRAQTTARSSAAPANIVERARKYLGNIDRAVSGQNGHDQTFHAAAVLVIGFDLRPDHAYPLLAEWNIGCNPPWSEQDLRRKLAEVDKLPDKRGGLLNANGRSEHRRANGAVKASPEHDRSESADVPCIDRAEGQTEVACANRLIAAHPDTFLYVEPMSRWRVFDGRRWADDQGAVGQATKTQAEMLWDEFSRLAPDLAGAAVTKMLNFVKASNSAPGIQHVESIVKLDPRVRITSADVFNRPAHLFNVTNGTLNLMTGELQAHSRADRLTQLSPVVFDPAADCPLWGAFLNRITAGNADLRSFLRRAAGYSLWGALSDHVLLVLYRTGGNGKSVFLGTLRHVFGEYATDAAPDLLLDKEGRYAHPTERADLFGMRFVSVSEAGRGRSLAEATVKQLTGDSRIKARRMREDWWDFPATHTLWLACNYRPRIHGADYGIWRRIKLVPFTVTIPKGDQDTDLLEKLKGEASGILNWCLLGCQEWLTDGKKLVEPASILQATESYRREMDAVGQFLDECTTRVEGSRVPFADLYQVYVDWCKRWNRQPLGSRAFGEELEFHGVEGKRGAKGVHFRMGISLVQNWDGVTQGDA